MDFALNTYMSHAGLRLREARPSGAAEKAQAAPDKDKWLPFFPKTKKVTELPGQESSGAGLCMRPTRESHSRLRLTLAAFAWGVRENPQTSSNPAQAHVCSFGSKQESALQLAVQGGSGGQWQG